MDLGSYPPPHDHPGGGLPAGELCGVLDNIRSALNVGTMLRAADGARLDHVHLCGLTPAGDHPKVAKTSLGAQHQVPWTQALDATECVARLDEAGWTVWAVESTPASVPLTEVMRSVSKRGGLPERLALIVGNETAGVDPALLAAASQHVHLAMHGAKTTLNVGVAFGAVVYGLRAAAAAALDD